MFSKTMFILLFLTSMQVRANDFLVIINNNYDKKFVEIPELAGKESFENEHFKIVYRTDEQAIKINHKHTVLQLKAATVFYHLTLARRYFQDLMQDHFPQNIHQLTVRIDLENKYDVKQKYLPQTSYNTALSIPPSLPNSKEKWGHEIWFRPGKFEFKKVNNNELVEQGVKIYDALIVSNQYIDTLRIIDKVLKDKTDGIEDDLAELGKGFAIDKANRFFLELILNKINYGVKFLETALNNEVIYHEYTHIVLSNFISIRSPSLLAEGVASFYATQISHGFDIASNFGRYSFTEGKHAFTEADYSPLFEMEKFAQHEFSYSLFFQMGKIIDEDFKEDYKSGNYFFNIIKDLSSDVSLKVYPDFTNLVVSKCKYLCENQFTTRIKLNNLMYSMGM